MQLKLKGTTLKTEKYCFVARARGWKRLANLLGPPLCSLSATIKRTQLGVQFTPTLL